MDGLTITGIIVTKDAARAILTTAVEAGHTHGFGYWGDARDVRRSAGGWVESLTVTEREVYGYEQTPHGSATRRTRAIQLDSVQPAILAILKDGGVACQCEGLARRLLDPNGLDGPMADSIIQVICFGAVIYG